MDEQGPDPRFTALYDGVVTNNADPKRLGRVKVRVPGMIEPESAWAIPVGGSGGGSNTRGFFFVPEVGAEVAVFFKQGDVDFPRYMPSAWGNTKGVPDSPTFVINDIETGESLPPEDTVKVKGIQTRSWNIILDDREGKEILKIMDRNPNPNSRGVIIELDGVSKGVRIAGTSAIMVECDGVINIEAGLGLFLNKRKVRRGGGEI